MKWVKSSGPKIEACGTPGSIFPFTERVIYFTTLKFVCEVASYKIY